MSRFEPESEYGCLEIELLYFRRHKAEVYFLCLFYVFNNDVTIENQLRHKFYQSMEKVKMKIVGLYFMCKGLVKMAYAAYLYMSA